MKNCFCSLILLLILLFAVPGICLSRQLSAPASATILCYMNGDNNLSQEILHTVDMMETVGSSSAVNVIVLVDGSPETISHYGQAWTGARMLHVKFDPTLGRIASPVIEEWGEADLGSPHTLEAFVRVALQRFPADRYFFYTFAHGRGVINTKALQIPETGKTLSISIDATSHSQMDISEFRQALFSGLGGKRFDLMVMFSCLTNMVEVGYAFSDITPYLVASEDEIRLLNQPSGAFQIRGMRIEEMVSLLRHQPNIDARQLGRRLVDSHMEGYQTDVPLWVDQPTSDRVRYPASMALVDCEALPTLVERMDALAQSLIRRADHPGLVAAVNRARSESQSFASFLNLEYYDLGDFIRRLARATELQDVRKAGFDILQALEGRAVVYERHTPDRRATGLSVYLSHPLVPQNIYTAHQSMYRASRFSRDTQWDEWIDVYRNHR